MSEFARMPLRSDRLSAGPFYTVINRTSRPLTVTVDGVCFDMQPGVNVDVPSAVAQYAAKQHPRRGTFDHTIQHGESLLVVKELTKDPAMYAMIPPGKEHLGDELIDRRAHPHDKPVHLEKISRAANYDESPFGSEEQGAIVLSGD
jgi:hypothetical protein